MRRNERIARYTADELRAMRERGESKSDWARAAGMTNEEVEAAVSSDPDEAGMEVDWDRVTTQMPEPKAVLNMRVDRDVLDYFRRQGRGYQTKINAVLRSYVEQMRRGKRP